MSKPTHSSKTGTKKAQQGWPLVVYVWMVALGFASYLIARIGLDASPHPVHWLSGLAGAAIGTGLGWLWYQWRGDII